MDSREIHVHTDMYMYIIHMTLYMYIYMYMYDACRTLRTIISRLTSTFQNGSFLY